MGEEEEDYGRRRLRNQLPPIEESRERQIILGSTLKRRFTAEASFPTNRHLLRSPLTPSEGRETNPCKMRQFEQNGSFPLHYSQMKMSQV